jgi:hypothetical protein
VWQHDKQGAAPVQASIGQVAQRRNFYDEETEIRLNNEVEIPGSRAIQKILDREPVDTDGMVDLVVYVGTMIRRVPFHRQWAGEISKDLLPKALVEVRENGRELVRRLAAENQHNDEWINERFGWIDAATEKLAKDTPTEVTDQMNSPFPSELIVGALLDLTWRVLETPGPQFFVTSDNPAAYFRWEGFGLGGHETELVFPLSPTVALHGSRHRGSRNLARLRVPPRTVREINKRLVSQASRFVFTHDKPNWLPKLLPRTDLGFMRLGW